MTLPERVTASVAAGAALLLWPGVSWGAAAVDTTRAFSVTQSSWGTFVKMLLVLAVVVLLIWVTLALLRRAMGIKGGSLSGIRLMGGVSLGPRKSLQFIKVGEALYLLGATDHHIGLISVIEDKAEIERITAGQGSVVPQSFTTVLRRFTGRHVARGDVPGQGNPSAGDQRP